MVNENNVNDKLVDYALENLHKATFAIPILSGYEKIDCDTGAIFVAKNKENSVMQYLVDGKMNENEMFEERLNKVIHDTEKAIVDSGLKETKLVFLEELKSDILTFKIFLQDNIVGDKIIRQANAYFMNSESKYFYEITLAAPPFKTNEINDYVTDNILERLRFILNNIKYNENKPF